MSALKDKLRADMLLFGKYCLPQMFSTKSPPFHRELTNLFSDETLTKLCIIAPRGHAKSSLTACVWVLHHLMFGKGRKVVLLVSKTEGHASRLLQSIQDVLDYNERFRGVFGYWGKNSAKVWTKTEAILKTGDAIICRGTGQQVVGLKVGDQRPTLVVLDDPEDMTNTKTEEAMEWNLRWLTQSLVPGLDPLKGRVCVIGTPQHQRCMVEMLMKAEGWTGKRYKALQDDGTALWEEWWSKEKLLAEKRSAESMNRVSSFYREFQCEVIGSEDQFFRESDFREYEGDIVFEENEAYLQLRSLGGVECHDKRPVNVFMGVDPASSVGENADFSVIMPVAIDEYENEFVLPYFRKRVTPLQLAEAIIDYAVRYKPKKAKIESVGYQEMLRQYVRSECAKRGIYIPGLEVKENPRTSKNSRLESLQPVLALHRLHMLPSMIELKDELVMFPKGEHDDTLDALYYARKNRYTPTHAVVKINPVEKIPFWWEAQTTGGSWLAAKA